MGEGNNHEQGRGVYSYGARLGVSTLRLGGGAGAGCWAKSEMAGGGDDDQGGEKRNLLDQRSVHPGKIIPIR